MVCAPPALSVFPVTFAKAKVKPEVAIAVAFTELLTVAPEAISVVSQKYCVPLSGMAWLRELKVIVSPCPVEEDCEATELPGKVLVLFVQS